MPFSDLLCQSLSSGDDSAFGSRVVRLPCGTFYARYRSNVDNTPVAMSQHLLNEEVSNIVKTIKRGRNNLAPIFGGHPHKKPITVDARVVHNHLYHSVFVVVLPLGKGFHGALVVRHIKANNLTFTT